MKIGWTSELRGARHWANRAQWSWRPDKLFGWCKCCLQQQSRFTAQFNSNSPSTFPELKWRTFKSCNHEICYWLWHHGDVIWITFICGDGNYLPPSLASPIMTTSAAVNSKTTSKLPNLIWKSSQSVSCAHDNPCGIRAKCSIYKIE